MKKQAYVTQSELPNIVALLAAHDVPDIYISDDRGGTGMFRLVALADFLPDLGDIPWEKSPASEYVLLEDDA